MEPSKRQTKNISERTYDIVGNEAIWFVPYMLEQFVAHQISFVIFFDIYSMIAESNILLMGIIVF